jgi:hypothetical protein
MAYMFIEGPARQTENNEVEISCKICSQLTQLDSASVDAVEMVINQLVSPANEIIYEDSCETFQTDDPIKDSALSEHRNL